MTFPREPNAFARDILPPCMIGSKGAWYEVAEIERKDNAVRVKITGVGHGGGGHPIHVMSYGPRWVSYCFDDPVLLAAHPYLRAGQ